MEIDELIERRNKLQLRAESLNESLARQCWERLGVANRHIERVLSGILALTYGVENEIIQCMHDVESWLVEREGEFYVS